jgi:hypothetical protein
MAIFIAIFKHLAYEMAISVNAGGLVEREAALPPGH